MPAPHLRFYRRSTPRKTSAARVLEPEVETIEVSAVSGFDEVGSYEIHLKGRLDPRWAGWFDGLTLTANDDGTSLIHGLIEDQAALHGLLAKVRDIGLPLISVTRTAPRLPIGEPRSTH